MSAARGDLDEQPRWALALEVEAAQRRQGYCVLMEKLPVTLCISTHNAAPVLRGCIESAAQWVSEIVVVDMESEDGTLEIARSFGARIVEVPAAGWAEPGRQSGIDAATQPWILVLDADERAAPGLRGVLARYVERADIAGVRLPRQNFQFGWWAPRSGIWPDWQLRLFRRERTTWPAVWTHAGPRVEGQVERAPTRVENAIVHHSYDSIHAWMAAANRYTDHEADRLTKAGRRASLPRLFAVPVARFVQDYLAKRGFRGGRYGLAVALMSLCYWIVAELKVWERQLGAEPPSRDAVRQPDADV
ncbi:MAG TPA: glycosyltransferase family 2 protein [Solirubrobacteraceae bacterium]|nr:glycosyltransferase family 2 protein [Solirubrobacteraceae bacterium]